MRQEHSLSFNMLTDCVILVLLFWFLGSGGSRKKYLGGLAPHHLGGNRG